MSDTTTGRHVLGLPLQLGPAQLYVVGVIM